MAATPGDYVIRRNDSETTNLADSSSIDVTWDTSVDTNGTSISYSSGVFTLAQGKYLVTYAERFDSSDTNANDEVLINGRLVIDDSEIVVGAGNTQMGKGGDNQACIVHGQGIIDVASDNTELEVRFTRIDDATDSTVNRTPDWGGICILALDSTWAYGRYSITSSTSSPPDEGSGFVSPPWDNNDEQDTGISRSSGVITVSNAGKYLVTVSVPFNTTSTSRMQFSGRMFINGTGTDDGRCSTTWVGDGTDGGALTGIWLLDLSASDYFDFQVTRNDGQTDTVYYDAGTNIQVVKLPSGTDSIILTGSSQEQNPSSATSVSFDTTVQIDTSSFTFTPTSDNIEVDITDDYLFMYTSVKFIQNTNDVYLSSRFRVDDVDSPTWGAGGVHNIGINTCRNPQFSFCTILQLTAADTVQAYAEGLGASTSNTGYVGLYAIRLGTLFPSSSNSTRGAELTGSAAATPSNSTRNAEISGKDTSNSTRDANITGSLDSNSTRDASISGKASDSSTRNSEVIGKDTSNSTRNASIIGSLSSNSTRDASLIGKSSSNNTRNASLIGKNTSNSTRDAELIGKESSSDTRDAEVSGKASINNTRNSEITGKDTSSSTRLASLTGVQGSNSTRLASVHGKSTDNSTRNASIIGKLTSSSTRLSETIGKNTSNSTRDTSLTGKETSNNTRDAELIGSQTVNSTRTASIIGKATSSSTRGASVIVGGTSNSTRSAELIGKATDNSTRSSELIGKNTDSSTRDSELTGKNTDNSTRNAEVVGKLTSSATRNASLIGSQDSNSTRLAGLIGKSSSSSTRATAVISEGATSSTRDAEISGVDTDSSTRLAELIGKLSNSSTRNSSIYGKISDSSTRNASTIGKNSSSNTRDAELIGKNTSNNTRDASINGKASDNSTRLASLTGKSTSSATRSASITGGLGSSSTRNSSIHGKNSDNDTRNAEIVGKNISNNTRGATLTGILGSSSTRSASTIGKTTSSSTRQAQIAGKLSSSDTRNAELSGILESSNTRSAEIIGLDTTYSTRSASLEGLGFPSASTRSASIPAVEARRYMSITRLLEQNVYYFLVSGVMHGSQDWSFINTMGGYPIDTSKITLPTTAVVRELYTDTPFEIGGSRVQRTDFFTIAIFCKSDGQRDDLAEYIKDLYTNSYKNFLDYNDGFPPLTGQSVLGNINFRFINMFPVKVENSQNRADNHRMDIRISTELIYDITA